MRRPAAFVTLAVLAGSGLVACTSGADSPASTSVATAAPTARGTGGPNGQGGGQRQPVVTGLVAAVSGTTMQVQSATKQTAVTWTPTTVFTRQASATLADVTIGACVVARAASGATTDADGSVTAATVQITPAATDGTCAGRVGGFGGGPGAPPSGMPSGAPSGAPSGGRDGQGGVGGFGAFGKVVAADASGFSVEETLRPASTASPTSTTVRVRTSGSTAYSKVVGTAAGDVKVGLCASANGQTGETGTMTATTVLLRDAVNGSCTPAVGAGGPTGG